MSQINLLINNLGLRAKDKITGFEGTLSSVGFDLYGCIQYVVTPSGLDKDGNIREGRWFDLSRLDITSERVMKVPDFENGVAFINGKGPAEKPASSRY